MHPLRHIENDPHDAPNIVPADWSDCVPARPANDAISREKLFAEIRHAAEAAAPKVDNTFRATDVNDIPALKNKSRVRAWMMRAASVFVFALLSAFGAAAWKHHGDAATAAVANWVPLPGVNGSPTTESPAEPAAEQQAAAAPAPAETTSGAAAPLPPEAEQQIQSLTRDLAAMSQQVEQLKATIETLKANQQAAVAPAAPVARAPAPPPKPKVSALPPRPAPAPVPPRSTYSPAMQATAAPPPAASSAPSSYPPPPPQATTQPNGEPIVRPPMPLPLSDRY